MEAPARAFCAYPFMIGDGQVLLRRKAGATRTGPVDWGMGFLLLRRRLWGSFSLSLEENYGAPTASSRPEPRRWGRARRARSAGVGPVMRKCAKGNSAISWTPGSLALREVFPKLKHEGAIVGHGLLDAVIPQIAERLAGPKAPAGHKEGLTLAQAPIHELCGGCIDRLGTGTTDPCHHEPPSSSFHAGYRDLVLNSQIRQYLSYILL